VEFVDRSRLEGRFQDLTRSHIRFQAIVRPTVQRAHFADLAVPRDSLSRIRVRDGSHWKIGALGGGVALALLGFDVGMTFKDDTDAPGCSGTGCVVGATAVFGAAGALAGGLLGALIIRWRLVWPP
jgi:hypothetical protein